MKTVEVLSIPSIDSFRRRWKIIDSSNGLLCVQVDRGGLKSPSVWLWNPVIREAREVPNTPNDQHICTIGFGFSSVVNDCKIVRFYSQEFPKKEDDSVFRLTRLDGVEVFSLSTGSWKEPEFGALHLSGYISETVHVDGTLFWLVSTGVVAFDIATEVVTTTQVPSEDGIHPLGLGVYQNKLVGHYGFREENGSHSFYVWVMDEVSCECGKSLSYTQKFRIDQVPQGSHTLCFRRNEMVCPVKKYITEVDVDPRCVLRKGVQMFNFLYLVV